MKKIFFLFLACMGVACASEGLSGVEFAKVNSWQSILVIRESR